MPLGGYKGASGTGR